MDKNVMLDNASTAQLVHALVQPQNMDVSAAQLHAVCTAMRGIQEQQGDFTRWTFDDDSTLWAVPNATHPHIILRICTLSFCNTVG